MWCSRWRHQPRKKNPYPKLSNQVLPRGKHDNLGQTPQNPPRIPFIIIIIIIFLCNSKVFFHFPLVPKKEEPRNMTRGKSLLDSVRSKCGTTARDYPKLKKFWMYDDRVGSAWGGVHTVSGPSFRETWKRGATRNRHVIISLS